MHLIHDAELGAFNGFGVSARARALARVEHWYDIESLSGAPEWQGLPVLIIGDGTNILFRRDFPGLVVRVENRGIQVIEKDDEQVLVRVAAGENWAELVKWCASRFYWGIENLADIPGCVGAAPIQNIGAYGCELSECLESVTAWDRNGECWSTLDLERCGLGYRTSRFRDEDTHRFVITEIALRLSRHGTPRMDYPGVADAIGPAGRGITPMDMVQAISKIRASKLPDPRRLGNAGSFFKNPIVDIEVADDLGRRHPGLVAFPQPGGKSKLSAAWLIDQCGWKGRREGDAGVYFAHALVLVNHGAATGQDIWKLAGKIQTEVHERFGINLEPEPTVI